ncbi:hypothetical protein RJ639_005385 [Escallonia herrerae]|uniref:Protein kinase domain-containing protein n=1 Tax=Escallonia herrerae TaxID=1293975 RepID=A0AA88VWU3_9ASTE|nr:hypothetical protein RJ639_005385 [Escallonia herrerae]
MVLGFADNELRGRIPVELGLLSKLKVLTFHSNCLSGDIPPSFGNLSQLGSLNGGQNKLERFIPDTFGQLKNLHSLQLSCNKLTGTIPSSVYYLSFLAFLSVSNNHLQGSLPPDLGLKFPTLKALEVDGNMFTGRVPVSLSNASWLSVLDITSNSFGGKVSLDFGRLPNLSQVGMCSNNLGSREADDLSFLTGLSNSSSLRTVALSGNQFGGVFPEAVTNFSTRFQRLLLGSNRIFGSIPAGIDNLINLQELSLESNHVIGSIPLAICTLQKLEVLVLSRNRISGELPSCLGNLTRLDTFKADGNLIAGTLPPSIGRCTSSKKASNAQSFKYTAFAFAGLLLTLSLVKILGSIEKKERLNIAIDVSSALEYLHHHCLKLIIHRDLKPSNVLLDNAMTAHIGDFGLARFLPNGGRSRSPNHNSSGLVGTIGYAAPAMRPTDSRFKDGLNLHRFAMMAIPAKVMRIVDPTIVPTEEEDLTAENTIRNSRPVNRDSIEECLTSIIGIGVACSMEEPRERMDIIDAAKELRFIKDILLGEWPDFKALVYAVMPKRSQEQSMNLNILQRIYMAIDVAIALP